MVNGAGGLLRSGWWCGPGGQKARVDCLEFVNQGGVYRFGFCLIDGFAGNFQGFGVLAQAYCADQSGACLERVCQPSRVVPVSSVHCCGK